MESNFAERISAGEFLANYYIEHGLSPDCTKDLEGKKRHLIAQLPAEVADWSSRNNPVSRVPFIMGAPIPYVTAGRKTEPDIAELEAMFFHKHGYNV